MRIILRAFSITTFVVLALLFTQHEAGAEESLSVEVPAFTNMYEGATYTVTVTAGTGLGDYNSSTAGRFRIGGVGVPGEVVENIGIEYIAVGTSETIYATITVTPGLMNLCIDGTLPWNADSQFLSTTQGFLWGYKSASGSTSCSVGQPQESVAVFPPALVEEVCGPNNDVYAPIDPSPLNGASVVSFTDWANNDRTITYQAASGFQFSTNSSFTVHDNGTQCDPIPVTIGEPGISVEHCGPNNDEVVMGSINPEEGAYLDYSSNWSNNDRYFIYVANAGYEIVGAPTRFVRDQNDPCLIEVSLLPPVYTAVCGIDNDTVTIPEQPTGVEITTDSGWQEGIYIVDFEPAAGYTFPSSIPSGYRFDEDVTPCPVEVEVFPPTQTAVCGPQNDNIDFQPQHAGVSVAQDTGWLTSGRTISYEAGEGYTLVGQTSFHFDDSNEPCVTPVLPTQSAICGPNNDAITIPDQPNGVDVETTGTWTDGSYMVIFTPAEGYGFTDDTLSVYTFTDDDIPCVSPVPPTQTMVCGENNDRISIPVQPEGVIVATDTGWSDGKYVVGFEPADGFLFPEDTMAEYRFVEDDIPCVVAAPPTITEVCGPDNDIVTIPAQPDGVEVDASDAWADNRYIVTFSPAEGFGFPDDTQREYTFSDEAVPCPEGVPVPPVQVEICGPNNDEVIVPDQPEGVEVASDGEWTDGSWTVTFSAAEGFTLPETAQTVYPLVDANTDCATPEPESKQLTVRLNTSDGGSIEGTEYMLYAPTASQAAQPAFAEGTIGLGNRIVFEDLMAGEYRLVTAPDGYDPIDSVLSVTAGTDPQLITLQVAAIQVSPTPSPEPTVAPITTPAPEPTAEPTMEPTTEPTSPTVAPTQAAEPTSTTTVTGLPETGTGAGISAPISAIALATVALLAAWFGIIRRQQQPD